jgi:purine-cytosine permease-like protein
MDKMNQSSSYLTLITYLNMQECLAIAQHLNMFGFKLICVLKIQLKILNNQIFDLYLNALKIKIASYLLV